MDIGASGSGGKGRRRAKNQHMAQQMKRLGIERTTGRCCNCYKIVTCDSRISTNKHIAVCQG